MTLFKHCQPFLLLLLCLCSLSARAQEEEKVTVRFDRDPVATALEKLQGISALSYTYNADQLPKEKKVTAVFEKTAISQVLATILKGTGFTYRQEGHYILIVPVPIASEKNKTTVTGRILDEESGEPVPGATVRIGNQQMLSDGDGAFVAGLPPGKYEAEISFVGYGTKKLTEIEVLDNKGLLLHVTLKREKGHLQGITVAANAKRESVAGLYIAQKNRASISDGISAEQIARTPDKNIGESLKRISGVATVDNKFVVVRGLGERYNGAILNGQLMPSTELNRKQFSFDIIPANLIDNVVVHKTVTSDMSAEFGGGLVAVQTKTIPTENFLTATVGMSVNDKTTGKPFTGFLIENKQYFAAMPDYRKLMGRNNWGSRAEIKQNFDPALFPNNWQLYQYTPSPSQNIQLSAGKIIPFQQNHKLGLTGAVSYRNTWQTQDVRGTRNGYDGYEPNPDTSRKVRAAYRGKRYGFTTNVAALGGVSYQTPMHKVTLQSLLLQTLDQQLILGRGVHEFVGEKTVGLYDLFTHTRLWQHQVKTEHLLGKKGIKLNLLGSYSKLNRQRPDNHVLNAQYLPDGGKDNPDNPVDFSIQAAQAFGVDGALRTWNKAMEDTWNWNADLTIPLNVHLGNTLLSNQLKTGYAGWRKKRYFWVINTGSGYHDGRFQPLTEYFDSTLHPGGRRLELDQFNDDMNKTATLQAGYMMMDHRIGKFRLVWGVRAEYYRLNDINAALDSLFTGINRSRDNSIKYDYSELLNREPNLRFFPSANLTYSLTKSMNLRLAYAKSIIRPDLREMSYFKEYDFELGGEYQSHYLQSTIINHYDFRYEWYPAAGEVVSLSLFYKKMDYPMEIYKEDANRSFMLVNNKKAINKGIELEIRKSLAFTRLPVLKNITVYGNGTRLFSQVGRMKLRTNNIAPGTNNKVMPIEELGPTEQRPQAGASNYMANAGLFYDAQPFSVSCNYNYVSNRLIRPTDVYRYSLYEQPLNALDAQVALNLMKQKMTLRFTVSNLLNAGSVVYSNTNDFKNPEKPTVKELLYNEGDIIDYEARPGRTFSFSLSYRF